MFDYVFDVVFSNGTVIEKIARATSEGNGRSMIWCSFFIEEQDNIESIDLVEVQEI